MIEEASGRNRRLGLVGTVVVVALLVVAYTQLCIFVVQPIGALPEGRTVFLWRQSAKLNFVDSADALCKREMKGVSLLCRAGALAGVIENNPIIMRLPYSSVLYSISTGGETYDR